MTPWSTLRSKILIFSFNKLIRWIKLMNTSLFQNFTRTFQRFELLFNNEGLLPNYCSRSTMSIFYRLHRNWCVFKNRSIFYMILRIVCKSLFVYEIETKECKLNFGVNNWENLLRLDFMDLSSCMIVINNM